MDLCSIGNDDRSRILSGGCDWFCCCVFTAYYVQIYSGVIDKISTRYTYQITPLYKAGIVEKYEDIFKENGLKSIRGKQMRYGEKYTATWRVQGALKNHDVCTKILLNDFTIDEFKF